MVLCCPRTLVTGAVGSLLLDWYGWPSVFYLSGGLTLLWVCYVYRYLLSQQGNRGRAGAVVKCAAQEGQGPGAWAPPAATNPESQRAAQARGSWGYGSAPDKGTSLCWTLGQGFHYV